MPVPVANLPAQLLPLPGVGASADGGGSGTQTASSPDLFRTALATAVDRLTPAGEPTRPAALDAPAENLPTANAVRADAPAADEAVAGDAARTEDETDQIGIAPATGLPVIDPTLVPGTLVTVAVGPSPAPPIGGAEVVAADVLAAEAVPGPAVDVGESRSRTEQLRFTLAAAGLPTAAPANQPQPPTTPTEPIPQPAPAAGELIAQQPAPAVQLPTTPAAMAVRMAQTNVVPAQAPIVTNLLPPAAVGALPPGDAVPAVAQPPATRSAPPVTETVGSDRPAMAGGQFEAVAEAGARLARQPAPSPIPFANVLDQTAATPTASAPAEPTAAVTPPGGEPIPAPPAEPTRVSVAGSTPSRVRFELADGPATPPLDATAPSVPRVSLDSGEEPNPDGTSLASPGGTAVAAPPTPDVRNPAPPTPASAPAPAPAVQLAEAVVTHARVIEREGSVEFRMRLDPPDLGPVRVRLVSAGDEIHGHLVVADDAVRRMVESQLPELRQRLEDAGVSVQRFDVATDPGAWGGGNRNPYRELAPAPAADAPRPGAPTPADNRPAIGTGLDVVV